MAIRFYKSEYPKYGDIVMISIRRSQSRFTEVILLEYNNIVAQLPTLEVEEKKLKLGDVYPACIISEDNKEAINVSIQRVTEVQAKECNERFAKAKMIHKLVSRAAVRTNITEIYERVVWHFETKFKKKNAAYDIFRRAPTEPELLDECGLNLITKGFLLYFIKNTIAELKCYYSADIKCYVKNELEEASMEAALKLILNKNERFRRVDIKSLGLSQYRVSTNANDAEEGKRLLNCVVLRIHEKVKELNGHFQLITAPDAIHEEIAVMNATLTGINF